MFGFGAVRCFFVSYDKKKTPQKHSVQYVQYMYYMANFLAYFTPWKINMEPTKAPIFKGK